MKELISLWVEAQNERFSKRWIFFSNSVYRKSFFCHMYDLISLRIPLMSAFVVEDRVTVVISGRYQTWRIFKLERKTSVTMLKASFIKQRDHLCSLVSSSPQLNNYHHSSFCYLNYLDYFLVCCSYIHVLVDIPSFVFVSFYSLLHVWV